jgi:hypothetical protein
MFKRDQNHAAILAGLKKAGCRVRDVAHLAGMGCDLIVARGDRGHGPVFLEIKNPEKPPSARKLTFSEETLQRLFPESFHVVLTLEEAFVAVGLRL